MFKSKFFWVGLSFALTFIGLGLEVQAKPLALDIATAKFFTLHRSSGEVVFAKIIQSVTAPAIIGALALFILALRFLKRKVWSIREFIPLAIILSAGALSTGAKSFFHRQRPPQFYATALDSEPGYPSSHLVFIASIGTALLFVFLLHRFWVILVTALATLGVGLDRLLLGAHWLSDLLGSLLLSASVYFIFLSIHQISRYQEGDTARRLSIRSRTY